MHFAEHACSFIISNDNFQVSDKKKFFKKSFGTNFHNSSAIYHNKVVDYVNKLATQIYQSAVYFHEIIISTN